MNGNGMGVRLKIVWTEGREPHVVFGEQLDDPDPQFLSFQLSDGHRLRLNKAVIAKIEEVGR